MPLRRRLVLGLLTVLAVTLVVVSAATYLTLRAWKIQQIDAALTQTKAHVYADGGDDHRWTEAALTWTRNGSQVFFVANGRGVAYSPGIPGGPEPTPVAISAADVAELEAVPTGQNAAPVTVTTEATGKGRAVALQAPAGNGGLVTVVAVTPLERATNDTDKLLAIEVVTMALALLFAGLLAAWFIRRSLRPLKDVADTASAVAKLPLERGDVAIPERVPDPVPTTEVGQVGLAVNAMLDHVEASLQTRADTEDRLRRFVSDAGHELRTPLAAVRGYAELMRRGAASDPESARAAAERIESAGSRMGTLVDDLLLLASLDEQRELQQERVDMRHLVDEAVAEAATAGPDHEWSLDGPDVPIVVVGDTLRLHQAVANLLANARSHTPAGTSVAVTVHRDERSAYIDVVDDGPGFPPELLPRVTERFARGDASRSRSTGGSGLGLAIVKAVTDAHGGRLLIANRNDRTGAALRVVLPLAPAHAESTSVTPIGAPEVVSSDDDAVWAPEGAADDATAPAPRS